MQVEGSHHYWEGVGKDIHMVEAVEGKMIK